MGDTRERLLEAARRLVQDQGAQRLTLEAVAECAGVSKGGLLYHFPSKEALLAAMVESMVIDFESRNAQAARDLGEQPGAALRAYLIANDSESPQQRRLAQGLAATLVNQPELLVPVSASMRRHIDQAVASAARPELALAACLASDGHYLLETLGLLHLDGDRRALLRRGLIRLADLATTPD